MSDVAAEARGVCGRIRLNRPHALNALTLEMVRELTRVLTAWANDAAIEFILIDGAGDRGLCAGGDVRALYHHAVAGDVASAAMFFREEYRLNELIAGYPKPYVALMDGLVMGGGIGISAHGTHRVVTERSMLAMPETGIGFIPDVGGTYLLGRAPGELGTWMALTGERIGAADAIVCGLADVHVEAGRLTSLTEQLEGCGSATAMEECLGSFTSAAPSGRFAGRQEWIAECFAYDRVEEILVALNSRPEAEATAAALTIGRNSPTALKVTLMALRRGRQFGDLRRCLEQEYRIAVASVADGDFCEGVRAALVDKDRRPVWRPGRLEEVTPERVLSFFESDGVMHATEL